MTETMRSVAAVCGVFAVQAAACVPDAPEATPLGPAPERWAEFAAQHPNILLASPAATNYAPPGWPFEPGQEVSEDDLWDVWNKETRHAHDPRGLAQPVAWVISRSGPEGALPFGPWVDFTGDDKFRYHGHLPVYYNHERINIMGCCFGTGDIPAPLRGIVDPDDHAFDWGTRRRVSSPEGHTNPRPGRQSGITGTIFRCGGYSSGHTNPRPGYHPWPAGGDAMRGVCDTVEWDDTESYGQCAERYLAFARGIHYGPEASW